MKRIAWIMVAALAALAAFAAMAETAGTPDFGAYLPEGATFVKQEMDDGATEYEYAGPDGARYELLVAPDGTVLALDADLNKRPEAAAGALTEAEAFEIIAALFPNARPISAAPDTDDGRPTWLVLFEDEGALNAYELDAATGTVLEYDRFFHYSPDTDPTAQIFQSYPGARITELSLDYENGRAVYEGEATVDGFKYDFKVDHATGQLIEWEMDD